MKTFYTNAKIFRNGRFEPGLIAVEEIGRAHV